MGGKGDRGTRWAVCLCSYDTCSVLFVVRITQSPEYIHCTCNLYIYILLVTCTVLCDYHLQNGCTVLLRKTTEQKSLNSVMLGITDL